ncbi:methyltransferase-like protein 7A [Venturia canescens]|uniref:methyltransferase-like protein 7A n=1 Tax=Venturia canescens TaxID=32260 RepID=UPI001C9C1837|nr:methyltransferase-like protein 7A [Venturia canescens]
MSTSDLWIRDIVSYYGYILLGFLIISWLVARRWRKFAENVYRSHLLGFETECADLVAPYKKKLFEQLKYLESNDEILRSLGRIRILEVGVKTGENIPFYPDGACFIGIDWNTKLADYLINSERAWQFSHVYFERLIVGDGNSLRLIPSDCVDAVVSTRSLCSEDSVEKTLREIRRVLAPGGKYLFLEHVPDPTGGFVHKMQKFLTKSKIWPSLFGNCHLDMNPIEHINRAGFKDLVWKSLTLEGYVSQPNHLFLNRHHVIGTATR